MKTQVASPIASAMAERIVNDESKLLESFDVGMVAYQGDVIIVGIKSLPKSANPRKDRQLADGNTPGSRHILERGKVYDADKEEVRTLIEAATGVAAPTAEYIGPVFVSPADPTVDDLSHPEHGNLGFPAGVVCAVIYQKNLDSEERARRSMD